jgi:hypothetical protein
LEGDAPSSPAWGAGFPNIAEAGRIASVATTAADPPVKEPEKKNPPVEEPPRRSPSVDDPPDEKPTRQPPAGDPPSRLPLRTR